MIFFGNVNATKDGRDTWQVLLVRPILIGQNKKKTITALDFVKFDFPLTLAEKVSFHAS